MLSGGERALTAVALLFAMLEVRPVPFCVLDEVDAALDEANIGRFADALRSLADGTQFVVITHNRGTIEAADALYGVTVGDDSVSRASSAFGSTRRRRWRRSGAASSSTARLMAVLATPPRGAARNRDQSRRTRRTPRRSRPTPLDAPDRRTPGHRVDPSPPEAEPPPRRRPLRLQPGQEPAPADAPFDPTAFLAVAPAHTLDQRPREDARRVHVAAPRLPRRRSDGPAWDEVEETLIAGDVGAALAIDLVERARHRRDPDGPEAAIRAELAALLVAARAGLVAAAGRPGRTGGRPRGRRQRHRQDHDDRQARRALPAEGRTVICSPPPTRSAPPRSTSSGSGPTGPGCRSSPMRRAPIPGAVVYDALDAAVARGADLVIADTAGRLHTKVNLMDELTKVRRIVDKRLPGAEPETLFVLDATTGQNGLAQARAFHEAVGLTGIVLTKLDSTSKGGIVFAIEDALKVPVRFVGVGEGVDDLLPFDPDAFVDGAVRRGVRRSSAADRLIALHVDDDLAGVRSSIARQVAQDARRRPVQDRCSDERADRRQEGRRPQPDHLGEEAAADRRGELGAADPTMERDVDPAELAVVDEGLLHRHLGHLVDRHRPVADELLADQEQRPRAPGAGRRERDEQVPERANEHRPDRHGPTPTVASPASR